MKEQLTKLVESNFGRKADKFCNSVWCIASYGLVCIISHTFDLPILGAFFLTVFLSAAFIFSKNSFALVPFLLMCSFVLSLKTKPNTGYFNDPLKITALCLLLVVLVASALFHLIYYGKWKKMFKRAYLTVSIAILTGTLMIGGIGTSLFSWTGVGMSFAVGACMFLPYSLLINCGEYNGQKTIEYFAYSLITAAVVIFAAVMERYITLGVKTVLNNKGLLEFGHTISNSAAVIVLLAIPLTFYLVYKYKYGAAFLAAVALELLTVVLTFSRATILIAAGGTVVVAIALCFKKKNGRLAYWIVCGVAAVAVIAIAIVFRSWVGNQITRIFDSNGRSTIWAAGFKAWEKDPVFGVGLWYLPQVQAPLHKYHSYHCSPLTFLYCAGIFGLAAYLYHRYKTVRMVFGAKLTAERVFVALTLLAYVLNSLLDIYMTEPLHLLYYSVMLALIEHDVRDVKAANAVIVDDEKPQVDGVKEKSQANNIENNNDNKSEGEINELQS